MNKLASPRRLLSIAIAGAFALMLATAGPAEAQTYPTFTTTTPIDYGFGQPQKMVLADFDGDGKADMATLGYSNGNESSPLYLEIFLGTGDGNFASYPSAFVQVNKCAAIRGLAAYGRDDTGSLNLAVLCYDTLQIWHVTHYAATPMRPIYLIDDPSTRQVITLDTGGSAMAIGDFTGIGSPGIAVLEYGADNHAHTIAVYSPPAPCSSCSGSSAFIQLITQPVMIDASGPAGANEIGTAITAVQSPPYSASALAIATEVLGTCGGNLVSYLYGGSGSFEIGDIVPIPAPFCASAIAAGDLDNDGYTDVVVGGTTPATSQYHGSGFLMTFNGSSDAVFGSGTAPFTTSAPSPNDSGEMSIVDLNGDGNADLVVGGPQPNGISTRSATVHIYFGNGDLTFGNDVTPGVDVSGSNSSGLSKGVLSLSANNINGDGSPELTTVDLIGDGSGGGLGNLAPKPGSFVQVFNDRTIATTTTIQAATQIGRGGGGEVRGATAHNVSVHPQYFGSGATTLQATVTPSEATGFVQFFDATTQAWIGSGALNDGIATLTVQVAGTHYYIASYYGSAPYQGSSSDAEQISPAKVRSFISIDGEPSNPAPFTPVVLSAFVTGQAGTPTGTVTFVDDNTGNTLGSATLDGYGNATLTLTTLDVGDYEISASYSGDNTYRESFSDDEEVIVAVPLIPATISLSASPTTSQYGSPVLATANIASTGSATPSGNLLFQLDSVTVATVAIVNGTASATLTPPAGQHQVQVVYAGDGISTSAQSNVVQLTFHGGVLQFTPGAATTIAGVPANSNTGTYGGDGGPATSAHLHTPFGLASFDGSTYIADEENNVIRKVAGDGTITTVAGQQYVGSIYFTRFGGDGGVATNAYLDDPTSVVLDSVGNLYIADYNNNVIRRVDAVTGIITTYAGDAAHPGYNGDSGPATSMHIWNNPLSDYALDAAAANLYIADRGNNLVRKVDTNGNLTTVAGHYGYYSGPSYGGLAINSPLKQPNGVAVDSLGNIYIADTQDYVVVKVDTSGIVTKVWLVAAPVYQPMQGDGGPALNARWCSTCRSNWRDRSGQQRPYIADSRQRCDSQGSLMLYWSMRIITTVAGIQGASSSGRYDPNGTPATSAPLVAVEGIAIEPSGSLLVADTYNQTVWRVGPAGAVVFAPQAAGGTSDPQFVTLNNVGDSPITFSATPFTVTGDYVVSSEGISPCSFSAGLAVGASCTLAVRYRPSTGALTGDVTFAKVTFRVHLVIHLAVTNIATAFPSSVQLEVDSQSRRNLATPCWSMRL